METRNGSLRPRVLILPGPVTDAAEYLHRSVTPAALPYDASTTNDGERAASWRVRYPQQNKTCKAACRVERQVEWHVQPVTTGDFTPIHGVC